MIMYPLVGFCISSAKQECRKETTVPHSLLSFSSFPVCAPLRGHPSIMTFDSWSQLQRLGPHRTSSTAASELLTSKADVSHQLSHLSGTSCLNWAHAGILCAPSAAVLSKQRLNLPSCWSGSDSTALWEIHLLPAAWPKLFSMPRKFWMSSHLFFSYCHQQRKWEIGKSWPVLQTKSSGLGKHWELTQREYKGRGVTITFAAKVLEVPRTQSLKFHVIMGLVCSLSARPVFWS